MQVQKNKNLESKYTKQQRHAQSAKFI